jgi:hypothetical protein
VRWVNRRRIWPPMGLQSGGVVVAAMGSPCGGWVAVVEALLEGRGCGGHTVDPVTGDLLLGSLAPDLGARVLVGLL